MTRSGQLLETGQDLTPTNKRSGDILRAILDSLTYGLRKINEDFFPLGGRFEGRSRRPGPGSRAGSITGGRAGSFELSKTCMARRLTPLRGILRPDKTYRHCLSPGMSSGSENLSRLHLARALGMTFTYKSQLRVPIST
uniref:Uncharacterized protein n=1 Tax=Lygus hesperus TaxID=30085 RepID=A0A146LGU7_LYGHE